MVGKLRELNPNDSLHAFYGWEVRRLRTRAGVSLTDLSHELRYSKTQISRIEAAERVPSLELSVALDDLLATEGHFARLWPHVDREAFPHRAKRYMELEQRAARIRKFMPNVMPGILQTEAYMRALFRIEPSDQAKIEEGVAFRLGRQQVFQGPNPPHCWIVMAEAALRCNVGGPEVMREQLGRLLAVARTPHVELQVLPFTQGVFLPDMLSILHLRDGSRRSYLEGWYQYHLTGIPEEVTRHELQYDRLMVKALSQDDSVAFVESVMEECYP